MDSQVENVSPEAGGNSLQLSLVEISKYVQQLVAPISLRLAKCTPPTQQYPNPSIEYKSESQSAKQRKDDGYTYTPRGTWRLHKMPTHT